MLLPARLLLVLSVITVVCADRLTIRVANTWDKSTHPIGQRKSWYQWLQVCELEVHLSNGAVLKQRPDWDDRELILAGEELIYDSSVRANVPVDVTSAEIGLVIDGLRDQDTGDIAPRPSQCVETRRAWLNFSFTVARDVKVCSASLV